MGKYDKYDKNELKTEYYKFKNQLTMAEKNKNAEEFNKAFKTWEDIKFHIFKINNKIKSDTPKILIDHLDALDEVDPKIRFKKNVKADELEDRFKANVRIPLTKTKPLTSSALATVIIDEDTGSYSLHAGLAEDEVGSPYTEGILTNQGCRNHNDPDNKMCENIDEWRLSNTGTEFHELITANYQTEGQKLYNSMISNKNYLNSLIASNKTSNIERQKLIDLLNKIELSESKGESYKLQMRSSGIMYSVYILLFTTILIISYKLLFSKNNKTFYNNLGYAIIILFSIFYIINNFNYIWNTYLFKLLNKLDLI